jgi:7-cyano-7-deazaguanine synthase
MRLDKMQTWALAEELGGRALIDLIVEETVTCYEGDRTHRHELGLRLRQMSRLRIACARGYERYAAR